MTAPRRVHADGGGYWLRPSDASCRRRLRKIDDVAGSNLLTASFLRRERTPLQFFSASFDATDTAAAPAVSIKVLLLVLMIS